MVGGGTAGGRRMGVALPVVGVALLVAWRLRWHCWWPGFGVALLVAGGAGMALEVGPIAERPSPPEAKPVVREVGGVNVCCHCWQTGWRCQGLLSLLE